MSVLRGAVPCILAAAFLALPGCLNSCEAMILHWAEDGFVERAYAERPAGVDLHLPESELRSSSLGPLEALETVKRYHTERDVWLTLGDSLVLDAAFPANVTPEEVRKLVRAFAADAKVGDPDAVANALVFIPGYTSPQGLSASVEFPAEHDFGPILAQGPRGGWIDLTYQDGWEARFLSAGATMTIPSELGDLQLGAVERQLSVRVPAEDTRSNARTARAAVVQALDSLGWPTAEAEKAKADPYGAGKCASYPRDT